MQNRYVGDVGDFGKHGLLRFLSGATDSDGQKLLRLGLIWYLYHDVRCNNDGRHISYAKRTPEENREEYRICDPELWEKLRDLLFRDARCVHCAEEARLLPEDTLYSNALLHFMPNTTRNMRITVRDRWWQGALLDTEGAKLICVDPDNGLSREAQMYRADGPKFTYMADLESLWGRGQSLVVYHHLGMNTPGEQQAREVADILAEGLGAVPIPLWFQKGHRPLFPYRSTARARRTLERAR